MKPRFANLGMKKEFLLCLIILVLIKFFLLTDVILSINQIESTDFNALHRWVNSIDALKEEDLKRIDALLDGENSTNSDVKDQFYKVMSMPLQSICTVGKFFGGIWMGGCGAFDGNKYVCLDRLYGDIMKGECLIYSFGISNEWSFEVALASMNCTIKAFDPTSSADLKPATDRITFYEMGLSNFKGNIEGLGPVSTLDQIISSMNDEGKLISYLKVDIEMSELKTMPQWLDSGILKYVDQIGIELHTFDALSFKPNGLKDLLTVIQKLHHLGFRLISYTPNDCYSKGSDPKNIYVNLFEVVFYKEKRNSKENI